VSAEDASGRVLATSLGLADHPEEFFHPADNWLALRGPDARVPGATADPSEGAPRFFRKRRGKASPTFRGPVADPLEQVMAEARAMAPATLSGAADAEARLTPVPLHSPDAVHPAARPWLESDGQGPLELKPPFEQITRQSGGLSGLMGLAGGLADGPPTENLLRIGRTGPRE
jgi:hypothetical protein